MLLYPIILCGGSGTRLWPLSRTAYPKQFLPLTGEHTMLQATVQRAAALPLHTNLQVAAPIVITNEEHRFLVRQQLQAAGHNPSATYLEPTGRNTAPAIALAALHLALGTPDTAANPEALMLVLPADHAITKQDAFAAAVATATQAAVLGRLVTFGITPTGPETGYGYIQATTPLSAVQGAYTVERFVEKPNRATAQSFIDAGGYCWNSGMFLFTAKRYLEELQQHRPDILQAAIAAWQGRTQDMDFCRPDVVAFSACPAESIDYAVMQPTQHAAVVLADIGSSDVGAWDSRLVAVVDVQDVVVVETPDPVLVMHKDKAQDIKQAVPHFTQHTRKEQIEHRRVHRPWGWYERIYAGERFQVKRIMVDPGAQRFLQRHHTQCGTLGGVGRTVKNIKRHYSAKTSLSIYPIRSYASF